MSHVVKLKRTLTPSAQPTSLADGELAANLADQPIRLWIGTPSGVKPLLGFAEQVEDAESDAVYGRSNGDWVKVPVVSDLPPPNPPPNTLWLESTTCRLFLWFAQAHWVQINSVM